jgi:hypothetical protein
MTSNLAKLILGIGLVILAVWVSIPLDHALRGAGLPINP